MFISYNQVIAMINFRLIKKFFFLLLLTAVILFIYLLFDSFKNRPDIKDISTINISEITFSQQINQPDIIESNIEEVNFEYKLIGIRAGNNNSSAILKKGNKEYLVLQGESLNNNFELIEVQPNSVVFRNGQKIYRIDKEKSNK
jgi:type II secretory pathway component PulC